MRYWRVPAEWRGERAFILAGGPSVSGQDISLLRGHKLIAVNSSYERASFADFLIFGDSRWWLHNRRGLRDFKGRIITTAPVTHEQVLVLKKLKPPPGFASDPAYVAMQKTTLTAAINLAVHLGSEEIVLLGADMQRGPSPGTENHKGKLRAIEGPCHHHRPHPWKVRPGCWDQQMDELRLLIKPLAEKGVRVFNASPRSRIDWWPMKSFQDCVDSIQPSGECASTSCSPP